MASCQSGPVRATVTRPGSGQVEADVPIRSTAGVARPTSPLWVRVGRVSASMVAGAEYLGRWIRAFLRHVDNHGEPDCERPFSGV